MLDEISLRLFTFSKLKGIGPVTLKKIASEKGFLDLSLDELAFRNSKVHRAINNFGSWDNARDLADKDINEAEKSETKIISILDTAYPELLKLTPDAPFFLYVKGHLTKIPLKTLAIIGTRHPTAHGQIMTSRIASYFASKDWSVVSGLAIGCDTLAHESALSVKGHTVGVLAHGLQTISPSQNKKLAEKILENNGALISEYAFGVEPHPSFFVKRDRIQAGLSRGVIMMQSDKSGGSVHATKAAIEYGRVLAIPKSTERDINNKEIKTELNELLCGDSNLDKAEFLGCDISMLDKIFVINGKEDYQYLQEKLEE